MAEKTTALVPIQPAGMDDDLHFYKFRIVNPSMQGYNTRIWMDDVEISTACSDVTVDSRVKDVNLVTIKFLASAVDIETVASDELELSEGAQAYLIRHGWTPPEA